MKLKSKKIVVTGGEGFLGKHVVGELRKQGASDIFVPRSSELDLREKAACKKAVEGSEIVIHLAAEVGGIGFIQEHAGEIFYNNIIMGIQLMEASRIAGVKKFVGIGTVCEYPDVIPLPFKEENLWDGYPEETTAPYGWAKKILIVQGKAYKNQYGFNAIHLLPVNLYGPGDNFDQASAHVIPSLIRKIIEAKEKDQEFVEVWGSGNATREFLYVEDAARGIVLATKEYNDIEPLNLGSGIETSIKEVTETIMDIVGYKGKIKWNNQKPDGQPRRQLDISKAKKFGYNPRMDLREGLEKTIEWYKKLRT